MPWLIVAIWYSCRLSVQSFDCTKTIMFLSRIHVTVMFNNIRSVFANMCGWW